MKSFIKLKVSPENESLLEIYKLSGFQKVFRFS